MGRDKVELFARIRDDHRQLGLGVRALARKHGVHRRMVREALGSPVRKALGSPVPAPRKTPVRQSPVRDSVSLSGGSCTHLPRAPVISGL
jgi:hypothetical protein